MKQTVEEAARTHWNESTYNKDAELAYDERDCIAIKALAKAIALRAFKEGATWQSKQSPWINVKERLPEEGNPVLIRLKDGVIRIACYDIEEDSNIYFWNDNYAYETFRPWDVTHWKEIPSFDDILEANRDVLERIKQKGD